MDMTVNKGYNLFLNSRILLSNDLLHSRTVSYHGSKKFPEKLYAFAICTPKKTIPNFSPSNAKAVRTPSVTRIVLTLYVTFPANTFSPKTISHIFITVQLIRKKIQRGFFDHNRYKIIDISIGYNYFIVVEVLVDSWNDCH